MKKIIFLLLPAFFCISTSLAQTPQGINYQGVARDAAGNAYSKQNITLQFTVLQNSSTVYAETQNLQTDTFGLYDHVIGHGTPTTGTFSAINWAGGNLSVKVDIDPGTGFTTVGTVTLQSVPYALYAASAGGSAGVTSVTANSPMVTSGSGASPVISIPQAGQTSDGYLSAVDWGLFNGKVSNITTTGGGITNNFLNNSYTLTVNNASPMWNAGALENDPLNITSPVNGQVLQYSSGNWINVTPTSALPAGVNGQILFNNGTNWLGSNTSNLTFINNMLGIGTSTPGAFLHSISTTTTPAIMGANAGGSGPAIVANGPLLANGPLQLGGAIIDGASIAGGNGDVLVSQGPGTAPKWLPSSAVSPWTVSGTNIFPSNLSNNVGIGNNFPTAALDVVNTNTTSVVVNIKNSGTGYGMNIQNTFTGSGASALNISHQGTGPAVYISGPSTANNADAVYIETHTGSSAIKGYNDGTGVAIIGYSHGTTTGASGIYGLSDNMGSAGIFHIYNPSNIAAGIDVMTTGSGYSGVFSGGAGLQTDKIQITGGAPAAGYVLTSFDALGNASWQAPSAGVSSVSTSAPVQNIGTGANPNIAMSAADGSVDGYLNVADWNNFNSKLSTVAVTPPLYGNGTGGAPVGMAIATGSNDGYLTSADWNVFNGKISSVGVNAPLINTGTVNAPIISLNASGVTAGTYGGPAAIPQFAVDTYGRLTNVNTFPINTLPNGANGQMLFNNGGTWMPTNTSNLVFTGTNMGLGNSAPIFQLDINSGNSSGALNVTHNATSGPAVNISSSAASNGSAAFKVNTASTTGFSGKFAGGIGLSTDKLQVSVGAVQDAVLISTNANGDAMWAAPINFSSDGGSTTSTSGSATTIVFGTTNYCNPAGAYAAGTYTAPVTGLYHFDGAVAVNITTGLGAPSDIVLRILVNGGIYRETIVHLPTGFTGPVQNTISTDALLSTGQTVRLAVFQSTGQSFNMVGGASENYFNGHIVR